MIERLWMRRDIVIGILRYVAYVVGTIKVLTLTCFRNARVIERLWTGRDIVIGTLRHSGML